MLDDCHDDNAGDDIVPPENHQDFVKADRSNNDLNGDQKDIVISAFIEKGDKSYSKLCQEVANSYVDEEDLGFVMIIKKDDFNFENVLEEDSWWYHEYEISGGDYLLIMISANSVDLCDRIRA
jgi:hypothetical protein